MATLDDLNLLRTFVRIAEAGSISAAARSLHTTQPTLSRQLKHLEWNDVLLELEPAGALRPSDRQARLLLARSNLSRVLDRMEASKLVETHPFDDDRRSTLVMSTNAGKQMRLRLWPVYAKAINAAVGEHLSAADAEQLLGLLNLLVRPASGG